MIAVGESWRVLALALPVRATSPAGGPDVSLARSYPGTERSAGTPITAHIRRRTVPARLVMTWIVLRKKESVRVLRVTLAVDATVLDGH